MVVFEPKNDFFSETKFLKYTIKLIYVKFWSKNNDVSFERNRLKNGVKLLAFEPPFSSFRHFFLLSPLFFF